MSYQVPIRRKSQISLKKQKGVVIVIALFIVALASTMAYLMLSSLARDTLRTQLIIRNTQAELYAQGSVLWAMDQLRHNWDDKKPGKLVDLMPFKSEIHEVNAYQISNTIYDMQARYNINNLKTPEDLADFVRLLQTLNPSTPKDQLQSLSQAIFDWVNQTSNNQYYSHLTPAYRAAHRAMISTTELRLVKGMTPDLYNRLKSYVTALPESTPINVNTATANVLTTLSESMTLEAGKALTDLRLEAPFISNEAFLNQAIVKNHPKVNAKQITVVSNYFLVETNVNIENQHLIIYTLLKRSASNVKGKTAINILWQSKGVY